MSKCNYGASTATDALGQCITDTEHYTPALTQHWQVVKANMYRSV